MDDLDGKLSALGARLRETVHQPGIDEVYARSSRRSSRRTLQLVVIVVVAVIAVAIPLLRVGRSDPAVPLPPPGLGPKSVDFFDATHGFALWVNCPEGVYRPGRENCTRQLSSTQDGQTWRSVQVPRTVPGDFGVVQALGPRSALVQLLPDAPTRLFTSDAGASWQEVSRLPTEGSVGSIPDGGLLEIKCSGFTVPGADCVHSPVVVALPGSGKVATLTTNLPFQPTLAQPLPDSEGTWWLYGLDLVTGNTLVARSFDAGKTWQVIPVPGIVLATGVRITVTAAGSMRYMIVTDHEQLSSILYSTDGGHTWQPVSGEHPMGVRGAADVGTDGSLTLWTADGSIVSHDFGRTFAKRPDQPWQPPVRTRAGLLSFQPDKTTVHYRLGSASGDLPPPS
ncbi:sialidase family protein [Actinocrispum sp. NPDC049592]|uniref:sialidase family protein n=1 Tax=Actinocrispum sp. NPDC049592 TaxID=3154835 RepID=UPI0034133B1F